MTSELKVSVRTPIPIQLVPDIVTELVDYLMYVTGQFTVQAAHLTPEQTNSLDRGVRRQLRRTTESLRELRDVVDAMTRNIIPAYITIYYVLGPSSVRAIRVVELVIPVGVETEPPLINGRPASSSDYLRLLVRHLHEFNLPLDRQPYRCYLWVQDRLEGLGTDESPALSSLVPILRCHEIRDSGSFGSGRRVPAHYRLVVVLNSNPPPASTSSIPMRLLSKIRGFATFEDESDGALDEAE
ncbi:hypothetical protein GMRT_12736 [Giardia muris]|uniref:Uncharacterized protein n=1 Tax=Giardia muris TaxID=5742 RepID=A0A4Z1SRP4_GIAMU|nr:hypothetical protein GMRT_12736 [Giardia muris]|eukprot:TNJ28572.1 hypothetical protein GMRT_12736 [Giardia muris]